MSTPCAGEPVGEALAAARAVRAKRRGNPNKAKGTAWESVWVDYLQRNGAPHAERRSLNGTHDRGDVAGVPGVVFECKAERTLRLPAWLQEAETERINDRADLGVVVAKRVGKTAADAGYVIMTPACLIRLLAEAGYITKVEAS